MTSVDGHHKLIRWRLVTHGAIDGYSRIILFLKCSNNNHSSTVYDLFLKAVQHYGLPSRIRCDQGRENIQVAGHMLRHRGAQRRSILVGSSVHNQRIERLWRDMHRCVCSTYYRLFYYLEYHNLLDPINTTHLFALHYVYIPRINQALEQFIDAWNNHGIRTEHGQTPNQLFTAGSLLLRNRGLIALDFFDTVPDIYGIQSDFASTELERDGIEVPATELDISDEQIEILENGVHPLEESTEFGVDLYCRTLEIIRSFH